MRQPVPLPDGHGECDNYLVHGSLLPGDPVGANACRPTTAPAGRQDPLKSQSACVRRACDPGRWSTSSGARAMIVRIDAIDAMRTRGRGTISARCLVRPKGPLKPGPIKPRAPSSRHVADYGTPPQNPTLRGRVVGCRPMHHTTVVPGDQANGIRRCKHVLLLISMLVLWPGFRLVVVRAAHRPAASLSATTPGNRRKVLDGRVVRQPIGRAPGARPVQGKSSPGNPKGRAGLSTWILRRSASSGTQSSSRSSITAFEGGGLAPGCGQLDAYAQRSGWPAASACASALDSAVHALSNL